MSRYDPRADRARRENALSRPEFRKVPIFTYAENKLPDVDRQCAGWAADGHGSYKLPFPVALKADGRWFNTKFDRPLEIKIVGWNYLS